MSTTTTTTATIPSTGATAAENARVAAEAHTMQPEKIKAPKISHGRGGAANIAADDTVYVDGGIVREGYVGDQGDGAYSTGRGGTANIGSPGVKPTKPADSEIIPETALRSDHHQVFHTGRGGEGNLHHETSVNETTKHHKEHKEHKEGEANSKSPSLNGSGSDSNEEKSKKRRSLFGRSNHTKTEAETDPAKAAKDSEKAAKKAEHEEKHPPPSHSGLGDKLKYKLFGRLYD